MPRILLRFLSLALSLMCLKCPLLGREREFIGIGEADGPALINGTAFADGSNLYAGDRIETGPETNFLVVASPRERCVLGPNSVAQFRKDGNSTIVALSGGTIAIYSVGLTRVILESLGVKIRPACDSVSLTEVTSLTDWQLRVSAFRGPVEITAGEQPALLREGQTAVVTDSMDTAGAASDLQSRLRVRIKWGVVGSDEPMGVITRQRKHHSSHKP